jgi:hypothetical protein
MAEPTQETTGTEQTKNPDLETQTVPYNRFKQVNEKASLFERQYLELKAQQEQSAQKTAEELAKQQGDYSQLLSKTKEKESQIAQKEQLLKQKLVETALIQLGVSEGIIKPEYINLYEGEIDITDDLEITNLDEVKKTFKEFKKANPQLFGKPAPVPGVDNSKGRSIDANLPLSTREKLIRGAEENMKK